MKIALIQCPVWGTYDPPLALAQLSSCLKEAGHEVFIFDLNIKLYRKRTENYRNIWAWEQCDFWYDSVRVEKFFKDNSVLIDNYLNDLIDKNIEVVGFSVSTSSRLASVEFTKRIKKINAKILTVFGGTLFFEESFINSTLSEDTVDIVVLGEGEITLCELVRLIESNQAIASCNGIIFKNNGAITKTDPRALMSNLDMLPFLDFSDLDLKSYDDPKHLPLMASRGCIQRCIFCSSRPFWPGFRSMSGERIFKEVEFHKRPQKKVNPNLGHVDFLDLLFNGNMKALIEFCDLMSKSEMDIKWTANMIIRTEMTFEVIKKMKEAGCEHIIFGIESGSQNILDLMGKHYRIEDADQIIKWTHEVGIVVTYNFMFGFPGETKKDFEMTLDFIKRNAEFLDRVYPSRTYCALEEYSYLYNHLEDFGINPNPPNHLYWESVDGENTYPVRLQRCEEFCNLAYSLGIEVGCGVQTSVELDKWYNLGFYYEFKKDYLNAIDCFLKYNKLDSKNEVIATKVKFYYQEFKNSNPEIRFDETTIVDLEEAIKNMERQKIGISTEPVTKLGREQSLSLLKRQQKDNSQLNDMEFEDKKIIIKSSPKVFFLQASGSCNSYCTFCSRGTDYTFFNLATHQRNFGEKLGCFLLKAEQLILTGSGEFLILPDAKKILDYFDDNFPHVEKMFSTNGSSLLPEISEKIVYSKSKYTIHVSLHSSNSSLHKILTRTDNFHKIIGQLNYLLKLRRITGNPTVHLIFVATTLNIEDLPNFVRFAGNLGVDKVICYYNYVYIPTQKYLSCFFKQNLTNKIFDEAEKEADRSKIRIDLPPRFGLKEYPILGICREPWSQIMLNAEGHIIPCDVSEDTYESLNSKDFMDVWNGPYFQKLRLSLIEGNCTCYKHCFRANPSSLNDFRSHVIHRGKNESEINLVWGDNF